MLTVDGGCIGQDRRETGWGFARETRKSVWGRFEVIVKPEGKQIREKS